MAISRMVTRQLLKRVSGGRVQQRAKFTALMRLPVLMRITVPLLRDERVPLWQRASVVGLLALIFSPLDLIGDIPVIGQFWDFTLAVTVLEAFVQLAPPTVVNEHIARLGLEKKVPPRRI